MKNTIFILALVLVAGLSACGNDAVQQPADQETIGDTPQVEPPADNTITGEINQVDTLDEQLDEEELDADLQEADDLLTNW